MGETTIALSIGRRLQVMVRYAHSNANTTKYLVATRVQAELYARQDRNLTVHKNLQELCKARTTSGGRGTHKLIYDGKNF